MNINEIAERAHDHAKKAGFLGDRNIDSMLMDIVDEVGEARHSFRNSRLPDWTWIELFKKDPSSFNGTRPETGLFEKGIKDTFADEMIDLVLIPLAIMKRYDIDIEKHIEAKMKYNELRDDHK